MVLKCCQRPVSAIVIVSTTVISSGKNIKMKFNLRRIVTASCTIIFLLFLACSDGFAAWEIVGRVTKVTNASDAMNRKVSGVILDTSSGARVLVEFSDRKIVHVRVAPTGFLENEFSYAIDLLNA